MTYAELHTEIRQSEQILAPGSESGVYGDYVRELESVSGDPEWQTSDAEVPERVATYWLSYYIQQGV